MTHTYNSNNHSYHSNAPIYNYSPKPIKVHFKKVPITYLMAFKERIDPDDFTCTYLSVDYFSIVLYCNFVAIDPDQMFIGFADDNSILLTFDDSFTPKEVEVIYGKVKEATEE